MDYELLSNLHTLRMAHDENSIRNETIKVYDVSNSKPTVFPWSTNNKIPVHIASHKSHVGIYIHKLMKR